MDEQHDCAGKVSFPERRVAEKAARRRPGRRVYKCKVCHEYHVGSHTRFSGGKKFKRPSSMRLG